MLFATLLATRFCSRSQADQPQEPSERAGSKAFSTIARAPRSIEVKERRPQVRSRPLSSIANASSLAYVGRLPLAVAFLRRCSEQLGGWVVGVRAQKNIRERKKEAEAGAREARRRGRLDERGGEEATQRDGTESGTRRIRGTSRAQVTKSSRPGRFLVFVGFVWCARVRLSGLVEGQKETLDLRGRIEARQIGGQTTARATIATCRFWGARFTG